MAFLTTTTRWLETQPYVKRAAWFGAYSRATPPDQFTSKYDAFYFANEALTRAGNFWINKA
jgi:type IV secretory pathway TrbF-like protein